MNELVNELEKFRCVRHGGSSSGVRVGPTALLPSQQPFNIESGFNPRLILRRVDGGDTLPKCIALCGALLRRLDRLDAAPLLSVLGFNLAHFLARMMSAAVVAIGGFSRGHSGS